MPRAFTGKNDPRNGRGGARAGAGRKPKEIRLLRESLASDFPKAIKRIRALMKSKDDRVAYDACKWMAEQVIGKAEQRVSHVDPDGGALPILAVAGITMEDV